jgi:hypothetical protein
VKCSPNVRAGLKAQGVVEMDDRMPNRVACGKCGEVLNEGNDVSPEKRAPCPKCGSKMRAYSVQASGGIGVCGTATVRMRATVKPKCDRLGELRTAESLRQELGARPGIEMDLEHPLQGIHRDEEGRAYFEFATRFPADFRQIVEQRDHAGEFELTEAPPLPGEECVNCGNVAGPVLPSVCPNCHFRDISPCPICGNEVSRILYIRMSGDLYRCPKCKNTMRLRFNSPMFLPDGSYNQPLVLVEEVAAVHEVR